MSESLLIVGSGGREHALAHTLGRSAEELLFVPGNGGTLDIGENRIIPITDLSAIARLARQHDAFTIVGPDSPLAFGMVDYFNRYKLPIFGPTQAAAELEWNNIFAAEFNADENIPQADFVWFDDYEAARQYALTHDPLSYVIKANGLADGKGANLPKTWDEAEKCLYDFMVKRIHGKSGDKVIFQERLEGPELSFFVLCDGNDAISLPSFRDYKRKYDGNKGPNTGGMGAHGPVEIDDATRTIIEEQIVKKVLKGMRNRGRPYRGILYIGLMLTAQGPKVIEYNARFGDPETQALMPLTGPDFYERMQESALGTFSKLAVDIKPGVAMTVALTAQNYAEPDAGELKKGDVIHGLDEMPDDITVFHGGTKRRGDETVTNGGRVLYPTTVAETKEIAQHRLYNFLGQNILYFAGYHYRRDMAKLAK